MASKPLPISISSIRIEQLRKRLPQRKTVTIAIGAQFFDGVIVCTDTNVVSTDGIVTIGCKMATAAFGHGCYTIANAGNDGNVGNMLGQEIIDALGAEDGDHWNIEPTIKSVMRNWHSGYAAGNAPQTSFVLGCSNSGRCRLYLCEPPNTVLEQRYQPLVIGAGAAVVDPLLQLVFRGGIPITTAVLQVSYLMYRAKRDHIFIKGSETDAMIVSDDGRFYDIPWKEMAPAEALGPEIDQILGQFYLGIWSTVPMKDKRKFAKSTLRVYLELTKKAQSLAFPSLNRLIRKNKIRYSS